MVSVAYRRGFDRIVVTTRATGAAAAARLPSPGSGSVTCWADPLASGEGILDQPERFTVAGGALAGAQAELHARSRPAPHLDYAARPRSALWSESGSATGSGAPCPLPALWPECPEALELPLTGSASRRTRT